MPLNLRALQCPYSWRTLMCSTLRQWGPTFKSPNWAWWRNQQLSGWAAVRKEYGHTKIAQATMKKGGQIFIKKYFLFSIFSVPEGLNQVNSGQINWSWIHLDRNQEKVSNSLAYNQKISITRKKFWDRSWSAVHVDRKLCICNSRKQNLMNLLV